MSTPEERLKVALEVLGDHAWVKTWVHHQGVTALLDALVEAKREIAADDQILADWKRLLDLFKCPVHGQCVPHAIAQVERLREACELAAERAECLCKVWGGKLPDEFANACPKCHAKRALQDTPSHD